MPGAPNPAYHVDWADADLPSNREWSGEGTITMRQTAALDGGGARREDGAVPAPSGSRWLAHALRSAYIPPVSMAGERPRGEFVRRSGVRLAPLFYLPKHTRKAEAAVHDESLARELDQRVAELLRIPPDKVTVNNQWAFGDFVVVENTMTGTNKGAFMGMPAQEHDVMLSVGLNPFGYIFRSSSSQAARAR